MVKKVNKTFVVSGQEIITYKSLLIDAPTKERAVEIYDEMWEDGDLIEDVHEFDIEVA